MLPPFTAFAFAAKSDLPAVLGSSHVVGKYHSKRISLSSVCHELRSSRTQLEPLARVTRAELFPEPSQARVFATFFSQPFISNLAKGKTGGNRRKRGEMGGDGRRWGEMGGRRRGREGMSIAIKIAADTRKQGKVTSISRQVFLKPVLP